MSEVFSVSENSSLNRDYIVYVLLPEFQLKLAMEFFSFNYDEADIFLQDRKI